MPKNFDTPDSTYRPMRIGIDIRCLSEPRTGVGAYVHGLLRALFMFDQTREYVLISTGGRAVSLPLLECFPHVRRIHLPIPNKILHTSMRLFGRPRLDQLAAEKIGIATFDLFLSGNIHIIAVSSCVPYLAMIHDLSFLHVPDTFSWQRRLWHRVVKPVDQIHRADHLIVNSVYTKEDIMSTIGVPAEKITVVSPGMSIARDSESGEISIRERYEISEKFVCCVATIEPRKNLAALVRAFTTSKLPEWGYDLVLVGSMGWSARDVSTLIADAPRVRYLGFVSEEEKYALLRSAELFVYASLFEGFGMPVLEAMELGTPVIAGSNTSLFELTGGAAWLVNSLSISDMREALEMMTCDETRRTQYATLGSARASRFSWERAAFTIHEVIENYEKKTGTEKNG